MLPITCPKCEGRGFSMYPSFFMDGSVQMIRKDCDYCDGKGVKGEPMLGLPGEAGCAGGK